ncbi:hypothetical protein TSAR_008186 [Trichomalopsis sarcophagae]|uniref:Uncharacterized protein n=1 Tax=Trichomalopsis sarcophagae TaxID=543379 RepID=A0A232EGL3_9HYME|nr:hypothetical protein TSAR_008186 [Trichomalopsis sarcophagae]
MGKIKENLPWFNFTHSVSEGAIKKCGKSCLGLKIAKHHENLDLLRKSAIFPFSAVNFNHPGLKLKLFSSHFALKNQIKQFTVSSAIYMKRKKIRK